MNILIIASLCFIIAWIPGNLGLIPPELCSLLFVVGLGLLVVWIATSREFRSSGSEH